MDFNSKEVSAVEHASEEGHNAQALEIYEIQLAFAGSGSVTVIIA